MSMADLALARSPSRARAAAPAYRVTLFDDWQAASERWRREAARGAVGTLFQDGRWLDAFYAAAKKDPALSPLIVFVEDEQTGGFALALPLVRRTERGVRRIEFADLGMTDFNAPLLGPAAPRRLSECRALWKAFRRALPKADLLCLQKMPSEIQARANPLAQRVGAHASAVNGNLVTIGEDYDAWRHSLPRTVRKELERSWRVFTRHDGAGFRVIADPAEALAVLETMEAQQQARLADLGLPYKLGDAVTAALYREFLKRGAGEGFAALSVLEARGEIVAALLGIRRGEEMVFVRLTHAGSDWSNCSPGRLVLSRTFGHFHGLGVRRFDLSVGNFAYKRRFGPVRHPLFDLAVPLSWRGTASVLRIHAGAVMRRHPELRARVRRLLGKPALREEH